MKNRKSIAPVAPGFQCLITDLYTFSIVSAGGVALLCKSPETDRTFWITYCAVALPSGFAVALDVLRHEEVESRLSRAFTIALLVGFAAFPPTWLVLVVLPWLAWRRELRVLHNQALSPMAS